MIECFLAKEIGSFLNEFSAVAILEPRQVGKTTLVKEIAEAISPAPLYLDLEKPLDLAKLSDPELYFQAHSNHLVIIDEIQRMPQLFQVLRSVIDERRQQGKKSNNSYFLVLLLKNY